MKEWICRELSTSTGNSENGVLMMETELIRCKECWCWNEEEQHGCTHDMGANDFCSKAERKEE